MRDQEQQSTHDNTLDAYDRLWFGAAPATAAREPAVEAQPTSQVAPPAASFAAMTGQRDIEAGEASRDQPLANEEAMIEQLAHGMVAKDLGAEHERFLAANGYQAMPIIRGVHEFVMRTFLPWSAGPRSLPSAGPCRARCRP